MLKILIIRTTLQDQIGVAVGDLHSCHFWLKSKTLHVQPLCTATLPTTYQTHHRDLSTWPNFYFVIEPLLHQTINSGPWEHLNLFHPPFPQPSHTPSEWARKRKRVGRGGGKVWEGGGRKNIPLWFKKNAVIYHFTCQRATEQVNPKPPYQFEYNKHGNLDDKAEKRKKRINNWSANDWKIWSECLMVCIDWSTCVMIICCLVLTGQNVL